MFFYNVSKVSFLMIACILMSAGCLGDPGSSDSSSVASTDGGTQDNNMPKTDIVVKSDQVLVTVKGKMPDGKPADAVHFCEYADCLDGKAASKPAITIKNVSEFEETLAIYAIEGNDGKATVLVERQNYLFVSKQIPIIQSKNGKAQSFDVNWSGLGQFCAAPNGSYLSSNDKKIKTVETIVKNGKCLFTYGSGVAIVTDHEITPDDQESKKISGKLSDDLSQIQLQIDFPGSPEKKFETTLTFVK